MSESATLARRVRLKPANSEERAVRLPDGRRISYAEYGDPDGFPVLALHGTPGSRFKFRPADGLAMERGVRLIAPDRAGYGGSTPKTGRDLAEVASDVTELANALGLERFAVVGISGGGPHAAACAWLMGERVAALGLVGPVGLVTDPDIARSLTPKFRRIFLGLGRHPLLARAAFSVIGFVARRWPGLVPRGLVARAASADRAILLRPEVGANLAESFAEGLEHGVSGATEDARLFCAPWGFDPGGIGVPTALWQGMDDGNVPAEAAVRLAERIPGCRLYRLHGEGHYWVLDHFGEVLDALLRMVKEEQVS
ncbi:MAG: alpha/beta fold hydrolase [Hyphomicrobiales bacterium]